MTATPAGRVPAARVPAAPGARRRVERPAVEPDIHTVAEIRRAARALLLDPLLVEPGPGAADLRLVRRHREELTRLFAHGLAYRLVVEPRAARLFKPGLGRDSSRPWRRRSELPFTPRTYALFCLTLAALTRSRSQLLVDELVAQVRSAAVDAGVDIDLDSTADRRALHAVFTRLVALGVLHERDGDLEHWVDQRTQSLLDVRRDVLPLLVSAPLASVRDRDDLLEARDLPSAAGGARVAIRRRLVEQPVLSVDDLSVDQAEWWRRNRHREREWFADHFGLELELRAEGAVAIDADDELTDIDFPGRGSVKHVALLLLAEVAEVGRPEPTEEASTSSGSASSNTTGGGSTWSKVGAGDVRACGDRVLRRWSAGLRRDVREDPASAAERAVELLVGMGLVRRGEAGALFVHAASARYAPRPTLAEASDSGERSLFDDAEPEDD